jgi:hypothetical protein
MTTSSDREIILDRIRRLLALSEDSGATAGESATAAKMATRLMAQYQLSEADLRVRRDGDGVSIDVSEEDVSRSVWRARARRMPLWQQEAGMAAANATGCRVYVSEGNLVFVGAFHDAAVACEVQSWLVARCDADTRRYLRTTPRGSNRSSRATASSFRNGWVTGVREAVAAEVAERQRDETSVDTSGRDGGGSSGGTLVVVSLREIAEAKSAAVDAWLANNVRLRDGQRRTHVYYSSAFGAGHARGSSVRIGTGANLR